MPDHEIEHFIHAQGARPKVATAAPGETLRAMLIRECTIREDDDAILIFIGECEEALSEPDDVEDGVDEHAPTDPDLTIEAIELRRHRHVHCHLCRHVAIEVSFAGTHKRRRFSPNTPVRVVTQWARRKFRLDPATAHEYVLQLCGTQTQPRPDEHVGELVNAPTCSLCFDLVKEVTPQGSADVAP